MAHAVALINFLHPKAPIPGGTPANIKSPSAKMKPQQFGTALNSLLANGSTPYKQSTKSPKAANKGK